MDKWISVNDQLPYVGEDGENHKVLMTDGYDIWVGYFCRYAQVITTPNDEYGTLGNTTHWMQLPDLPGGEK